MAGHQKVHEISLFVEALEHFQIFRNVYFSYSNNFTTRIIVSEFPPKNYIRTASAVEGIEVFAPRPLEPDESPEIVDFHCPQCGATTAYSLEDGGLKCAHCGYFEPPAKEIVGRGAQDFEFKVEALAESAHGWGTRRSDLVCENCGAETSFPPGTLSTRCAFCGSNKVLQREGLQSFLRPRFLIPFQLDENRSLKIAKEWLGSSWMVPDHVKSNSSLEAFTPVYIPYWTFDAAAFANWKAQVGYDETERYYDASNNEWRTRTVTRWRWEDGAVRQDYDDLLVSGTQRISSLHLRNIQNFKLRELVVYSPEYLAGIGANAYDVPLEPAWEKGRYAIRADVYNLCHKQIKGDHIRRFEMALDLAEESWRYVLLPVLINAFYYRGRSYRIVINGQTGKISGQRPVDWIKVWLVNVLMLAPGLVISLLGLVLQFGSPEAFALFWVGIGLLVLGLAGMAVVLTKASGMDDE